jgi:hypothetical protein
MFLPWVTFSLLDAIVSPLLQEGLFTALGILVDLLEFTPLSIATWLMERMTALPGYVLLFGMPRMRLFVIGAVAAPGVAATLSLVTGLITLFVHDTSIRRIVGRSQLLISIVGLVLLLANMPCLDKWGTSGDFKSGLLAVSMGAGLGFGAWIGVLSLILMAIGAHLILLEPPHTSLATQNLQRPIYARPSTPRRRGS